MHAHIDLIAYYIRRKKHARGPGMERASYVLDAFPDFLLVYDVLIWSGTIWSSRFTVVDIIWRAVPNSQGSLST